MNQDDHGPECEAPAAPERLSHHRNWARLSRHLEVVLSIYDALDLGDSEHAATAQSALDQAKRTLRTHYGPVEPIARPTCDAVILPFPATGQPFPSTRGEP